MEQLRNGNQFKEGKMEDGSNVQETDAVTLGDKRVETSQYERYKGRKGKTDRIAILSGKLQRAYTYFFDGGSRKVLFRAPTSKEMQELCIKTLGQPQQRFGLVLFHYRTDEDTGELIDEKKCQGRPKLWVISESRYEELSGINRKWPLLNGGFDEKQVDLEIKCSEEQYQRMNFTPTPTAHWKKNEAWYNALVDKETKAQDRLKSALGRPLKDHEIMELLGASVPAQTGSTDNAGEIDLRDVLDEPE